MKTKNKFSLLLLVFLSVTGFLFSETKETAKWTIATQKFEFIQKDYQESSEEGKSGVEEGMATTFPLLIMEKLDANLVRSVYPDEKLERKKYELKKERISLFLQLSGLVKTRDSLFLYDYSPYDLKLKQKEQDKKIKEIQKKINDNLNTLAKEELAAQKAIETIEKEKNAPKKSFKKVLTLLKNFFTDSDNLYTQEQINFYSGSDGFYTPSTELKEKAFDSAEFEREMVNNSINTLITGTINKIGEYFSITVDVYMYPGAKKIASCTEVGSTSEIQMLASEISKELIPVISNSIPVELNLKIANENINPDKVTFFVDDVIQDNLPEKMEIDSGVHFIQFICEGYKSVGTAYNFEGNKHYDIEIDFREETEKSLTIRSVKPLTGSFFANGSKEEDRENQKSKIKIEDKLVLGEFLSEEGETAFFYIPQKLVVNDSNLSVNVKPFDRGEYVEKRRKAMYFSYSLLMVSLIPSFYTYGSFSEYASYYNKGYGDYKTGLQWQNASYITAGITICCGAFFTYELVRYIISAEGIIPKSARKTSNYELAREKLVSEMLSENESPVPDPVSEQTVSEAEISEAESEGAADK